jgi:hypothetical protein
MKKLLLLIAFAFISFNSFAAVYPMPIIMPSGGIGGGRVEDIIAFWIVLNFALLVWLIVRFFLCKSYYKKNDSLLKKIFFTDYIINFPTMGLIFTNGLALLFFLVDFVASLL